MLINIFGMINDSLKSYGNCHVTIFNCHILFKRINAIRFGTIGNVFNKS